MAGEIHKGDVATIMRVMIVDQDGVAVDLSGATTKDILFIGPGRKITKETSFQTDGTNGVLDYVIVEGDISAFGKWTKQWHIILPTGEWHTTAVEFPVLDNII